MFKLYNQEQIGASYKLAIVILIGTINSFMPWNMWALTSGYFLFQIIHGSIC